MTGRRWLTHNKTRELLGLSWAEFRLLLKSGDLKARLVGDDFQFAEDDVNAYLAERGGDDPAETSGPTWQPWTDPDFRREQADYSDTPNDEGDEQQ